MKRAGNLLIFAIGLPLAVIIVLFVFGLPIGQSVRDLIEGSLSTQSGVSRSLVKMTPLLLAGLGMTIAWRAGIFNIGGEGQFLVGALAGAAVAKTLATTIPGAALNPLILTLSFVAGGLFATFAGWLQIARGVPVVISTILLNFIATYFQDWLVSGPLQMANRTLPQTDTLPETAMLLKFSRQLDAHIGIVLALFLAIAIYVFLYKTPSGFRLRLAGANERAARANGVNANRVILQSMMLSGGLCGLAGGVEYTAITGVVGQGFSQGWGFLAIPVALLGGLNPLGVVGSSFVFGVLFAGSENLSRFASGGDRLIYVVQAVCVLAYIGIKAERDRRQQLTQVQDA